MNQTVDANSSNQHLMRQDLERSLHQRAINPLTLSALQRILLTTDGTVTEILEAYFGEAMRVVKLSQDLVTLDCAIQALGLNQGHQVLSRKILLQGKLSRVNFLYAESVIAPDRLDEHVRDGLLKSNKPIGQLILEHRIETFKEILDCGKEPAGSLTEYFPIDGASAVIFRTYRVFANQQPVMVITEKFPESHFLNWNAAADSRVVTGEPLKGSYQSEWVDGHQHPADHAGS